MQEISTEIAQGGTSASFLLLAYNPQLTDIQTWLLSKHEQDKGITVKALMIKFKHDTLMVQ